MKSIEIYETIQISGNGKEIMSTTLDGTKRPSLLIFENPNKWIKLATFSNEENARMFMNYLGEMMNAERVE